MCVCLYHIHATIGIWRPKDNQRTDPHSCPLTSELKGQHVLASCGSWGWNFRHQVSWQVSFPLSHLEGPDVKYSKS